MSNDSSHLVFRLNPTLIVLLPSDVISLEPPELEGYASIYGSSSYTGG